MATTGYDAFLVYQSADRGIAALVVSEFESVGVRVWSERAIRPGDHVPEAIRDAMSECDNIVIVLTPNSVSSPHTAYEIGMGQALGKPIYVLYDGIRPQEIPDYLRAYQVARVSRAAAFARKMKSEQRV